MATDERKLVKLDNERSKIPFEWDAEALAGIRPDQMPRMLGAITHPELNEVKVFKWEELTAIQNRVDTTRVEDIALSTEDGPAGVVGKFNGKNYILDGHHRSVGYWLRGDEEVQMHFINLQPMSNAMKAQVCKVDASLGLVFGWAIVCKENGEDYFDTQDEHIPEPVMLEAAFKAAPTLVGADMHVWKDDKTPITTGDIHFMFPLTTDIAEAMGLKTETTGLMIAYKPHTEEILKKFQSGEYTGFSVGGYAEKKDA